MKSVITYYLLALCLLGPMQARYIYGTENRNVTNDMAYRFFSRYDKELELCQSKKEINRKLQEDGVSIRINGVLFSQNNLSYKELQKTINASTIRSIESDEYYIRLAWIYKNDTISCYFQREYELLLGKSKPDLEKEFIQALSQTTWKIESIPENPENLIYIKEKGYYKQKNSYYYKPEMANTLYYRSSGDSIYQLIFDTHYPIETLQNMFSCGLPSPIPANLKIKHFMYGKIEREYSCPLQSLISMCKPAEFTIYTGFEEINKLCASGTVIFRNNELGYIHLLHFTCPLLYISSPLLTIEVELYTYIPTHNISNLFQQYKQPKKKTL